MVPIIALDFDFLGVRARAIRGLCAGARPHGQACAPALMSPSPTKSSRRIPDIRPIERGGGFYAPSSAYDQPSNPSRARRAACWRLIPWCSAAREADPNRPSGVSTARERGCASPRTDRWQVRPMYERLIASLLTSYGTSFALSAEVPAYTLSGLYGPLSPLRHIISSPRLRPRRDQRSSSSHHVRHVSKVKCQSMLRPRARDF